MGIDGDEARLFSKLAQIEALYEGATTEGERNAAAAARDRIQARVRALEKTDPPVDLAFSIHDPWQRRLFCALARRFGIKPYRHRGQHRTTVMLRVPRGLLDATFWPEFLELSKALHDHLDAVTRRVIAGAIHEDGSDECEEPKRLAGAATNSEAQ